MLLSEARRCKVTHFLSDRAKDTGSNLQVDCSHSLFFFDQELFLEAYTSFTTKSEDAGSMQSLRRWFSSVERLPDSWPSARLSITLDGLTSPLSKVVMTATMEIIASCRYPDFGLLRLTQLAKDVTIALALHLADLVADWLCGILDQQAVLLFNESTAGMLQASYWVRPIYEELLYSSSHAYQGSAVEAQRASNGLVKVISSKTGSDGDQVPQTSSSCISPLAVLGKSLSASVLPPRINLPILHKAFCRRGWPMVRCVGTHNRVPLTDELQDCHHGFFVQITITRAIPTHAVDVTRWCNESGQLMHLDYQYYAGDSHQFLVGVAHGFTLLASIAWRPVGAIESRGMSGSSWSCATGILLCTSIQYMPPSATWMRAMTQGAPTWLRHQRDRLASLRRQ